MKLELNEDQALTMIEIIAKAIKEHEENQNHFDTIEWNDKYQELKEIETKLERMYQLG